VRHVLHDLEGAYAANKLRVWPPASPHSSPDAKGLLARDRLAAQPALLACHLGAQRHGRTDHMHAGAIAVRSMCPSEDRLVDPALG
jgi:hypothetical protein